MNIFSKIKTFFVFKGFIEEELKEAKMPTTSGKPGWKTTEFWMNLSGQAVVLWGAVKGFVPPLWAVIITIAGTAVYTVARTIAKAVSDMQIAKSAQVQVK